MSEENGRRTSPAIWSEATGALPGMARIAATAGVRSAAWTIRSGVRSTRLFARALTDPETAGELVQEVARDVAEASRTVSDVARALLDIQTDLGADQS